MEDISVYCKFNKERMKQIFILMIALLIAPLSVNAFGGDILNQYDFASYSLPLYDGANSTEIQFRVTTDDLLDYPTHQIAMTFTPVSNQTSLEGTLINFVCLNPATGGAPLTGSIPLQNYWVKNQTYFHLILCDLSLGFDGIKCIEDRMLDIGTPIPTGEYLTTSYMGMPMVDGGTGQWLSGTDGLEASSIAYSQSCSFSVTGQDVLMFYGPMYIYDNSIQPLFYVPTQASNNILDNLSDSLGAAFDVVKLVLIGIGLLLLLFIIVFAYKLLVYFVRQVKGNREEEQQ